MYTCGDVQEFLLDPLRAVQKPQRCQRLLEFEAMCTDQFSPFVDSKEQMGEHAEPESQTKNVDKRPQKEARDTRPSQAVSFVSEREAPPQKDIRRKM